MQIINLSLPVVVLNRDASIHGDVEVDLEPGRVDRHGQVLESDGIEGDGRALGPKNSEIQDSRGYSEEHIGT
uniref:Harpin-induced 1 n=1 Tax=Solanum tuberosum TaxID=4113 RepID=M1CND0_SOLTU